MLSIRWANISKEFFTRNIQRIFLMFILYKYFQGDLLLLLSDKKIAYNRLILYHSFCVWKRKHEFCANKRNENEASLLSNHTHITDLKLEAFWPAGTTVAHTIFIHVQYMQNILAFKFKCFVYSAHTLPDSSDNEISPSFKFNSIIEMKTSTRNLIL